MAQRVGKRDQITSHGHKCYIARRRPCPTVRRHPNKPRRLARRVDTFDGLIDCLGHGGRGVLAQLPHIGGQIGRTDKHRIHSVHGGNRIDVAQGRAGFDL